MRYDDNLRWMSPISLNPYAKRFFTFSGNSTVVLGKVPSFDVELGAVPTWDFHPYEVPLVLTMPTWLTVGPADRRSAGRFCGSSGVPWRSSKQSLIHLISTRRTPAS
jgi:hypothetical protein